MDAMVSVIITAYNAEKYIRQCIESILHQTYHNLEIILVDDGSTDATGQIITKMSEADERIKIFTKENAGVSSARNKGIDLASEDLIMFVDSDDYLAERTIEVLYETYMRNPKEIPQCDFIQLRQGKATKTKRNRVDGLKVVKADVLSAVITGSSKQAVLGGLMRTAWGKLFCRNIIIEKNIRFHENLYFGEDAVFLLEYLQYVDSICIVDYYGYYYRIWQGSACQRAKHDLYFQCHEQFYCVEEIMQRMGLASDTIIETSMTMLSWLLYQNLIHNERQILDKHMRDSDKWYIEQQDYLNNSRAVPTSKYINLIWKISRISQNSKIVHFISVLYDEYDNRKQVIRRLLGRE